MEKLFNQIQFSDAVREKMMDIWKERKRRVNLAEMAKEIGISKATLSRVENNGLPDLETYFRLCYWMKRSTNEFYKHG